MASTEEVLAEIKMLRAENATEHRAITGRINVQGERLMRVETQIEDIRPKLTEACKRANGASQKAFGLAGQWKILAAILTALALGIGGWLLKGVIG